MGAGHINKVEAEIRRTEDMRKSFTDHGNSYEIRILEDINEMKQYLERVREHLRRQERQPTN